MILLFMFSCSVKVEVWNFVGLCSVRKIVVGLFFNKLIMWVRCGVVLG